MNCPYCNQDGMPPPPRVPRPYGQCPFCGKKSRAVIWNDSAGTTYYRYVKTSKPVSGYVTMSIRVRPDQRERLREFFDASEVVRLAIDKHFGLQ